MVSPPLAPSWHRSAPRSCERPRRFKRRLSECEKPWTLCYRESANSKVCATRCLTPTKDFSRSSSWLQGPALLTGARRGADERRCYTRYQGRRTDCDHTDTRIHTKPCVTLQLDRLDVSATFIDPPAPPLLSSYTHPRRLNSSMQGTARGVAARAELVQLVARAKSEKRQLGRAQDRGLETHATRLRPAQGAVSHAASPAAIPRLDFSLSDSEKQAVRPLTMRPKTAPAADTEFREFQAQSYTQRRPTSRLVAGRVERSSRPPFVRYGAVDRTLSRSRVRSHRSTYICACVLLLCVCVCVYVCVNSSMHACT